MTQHTCSTCRFYTESKVKKLFRTKTVSECGWFEENMPPFVYWGILGDWRPESCPVWEGKEEQPQ